MPTNHDETLDQRYAREQSEHLAELTKRTPEEIAYMEQLLHNVLAERDQLATKVADLELALFAENQKRADVERERDQLLAALKEAREALAFANDTPGGPIIDTIWMMHRPETLLDHLDAAIAAVKGGA